MFGIVTVSAFKLPDGDTDGGDLVNNTGATFSLGLIILREKKVNAIWCDIIVMHEDKGNISESGFSPQNHQETKRDNTIKPSGDLNY